MTEYLRMSNENMYTLHVNVRYGGQECAQCGTKAESVEKFNEMDPIKGLGEDIVCRGCWPDYCQENGINQDIGDH